MKNEKQLTFINENGEEILCEILFTFDSEEFKKSYVLFYPVGEENDEQIEVMAAAFTPGENGDGELFAVETDEEWEMIESVLQSFDEEEDCDCEDCDDDCEEDHEDCCCEGKHHHHK